MTRPDPGRGRREGISAPRPAPAAALGDCFFDRSAPTSATEARPDQILHLLHDIHAGIVTERHAGDAS